MPHREKIGVYVIEQRGTGRYYIGSTYRIYRRWGEHRKLLDRGKHHSPFLQHAWEKYGADAFEFYVLEECSQDELLIKEQEYIDAFKPEFNVNPTAGSRLGSKSRPETVAKQTATIRATLAARTHCPAGHEYTPENTALYQKARICRECARQLARKRQAGFTPEERARQNAYFAERYQARKDVDRDKRAAYAAAHKVELAERARQRRERLKAEETPEQHAARLEKARERYYANIEAKRESSRLAAVRYRERYPERARASQSAYLARKKELSR